MKKNLLLLLVLAATLPIMLAACGQDDSLSKTSVVRESTNVENDFDRWLTRHYMDPYNIEVKYRYDDDETDMSYYLVPADYDMSIAVAKHILYICLESYDEVTGSQEFIRNYFPKCLVFLGCPEYKTNNTVVNGTAEAGSKITIFRVCPQSQDSSYGMGDPASAKLDYWGNEGTFYFKTIFHEFTHIFNQQIPYTTDFKALTDEYYVYDDWDSVYSKNGTGESSPYQHGFVSAYAGCEDTEDFAEMVSIYILSSAEEWESMLQRAEGSEYFDARSILEEKTSIVYNYMENNWGINLDDLREVVHKRAEDLPYLDYTSLND